MAQLAEAEAAQAMQTGPKGRSEPAASSCTSRFETSTVSLQVAEVGIAVHVCIRSGNQAASRGSAVGPLLIMEACGAAAPPLHASQPYRASASHSADVPPRRV